jgi:hypothetical protein
MAHSPATETDLFGTRRHADPVAEGPATRGGDGEGHLGPRPPIAGRDEVEHARRLDLYRAARSSSKDDPHRDAVIGFGIAYEEAIVNWLASLERDGDDHAPGT